MVTALEHSIWNNLIYVLEPCSLILGSYFLWGENCVLHPSLLQWWETKPFSRTFYPRLVRTSLRWGINTVPYKLGYLGHTGGSLLPHHFQINTRYTDQILICQFQNPVWKIMFNYIIFFLFPEAQQFWGNNTGPSYSRHWTPGEARLHLNKHKEFLEAET